MRSLAIVFVLLVGGSVARGDAMERVRPEKLRATHEKIEALKGQRREVSLSSGYDDVRSLLPGSDGGITPAARMPRPAMRLRTMRCRSMA